MSRIRNGNEFLIKFVEIRKAYESSFAPRLEELRSRFAAKPQWQAIQPELEYHRRCYIINGLLAALNWRLDVAPGDGLPNLIPEQPVTSADTGRIRFLDYFGIDRATDRPLLIVEAKRQIELPSLAAHPSERLTESMVVSRGLKGEKLTGEWSTWLSTTTDYVRSVTNQGGAPPNRVVLTDGYILFAFLDPTDAFLTGGTSSVDRILVCDLRTLNDASAAELFGVHDYDVVSSTARPLLPGQILFSLDAKDIDRAMHGLTLVYERVGRVFHPSPIVTVSPILFIGSRNGSWTIVDGPSKDIELPRKYDELNTHLNDITKMGQELLAQVNEILKKKLRVISLVDHYADEDSFKALRGIRNDRDKYAIVTGEHYHYLLKAPAKPQCLHHEWAHSKGAGIETNPGPILARSVDPRSFFYSSESHHCTHRDVHATRAEPMKPQIREKCGTRSGQDNEAFCEIWSFETHLCCRTCAFLDVCSKAEVFYLPCERP